MGAGIVILIVFFNLILGLFVYKKTPQKYISKPFLLLTISVALWVVASFMTDHAVGDYRLLWARLSFSVPAFATVLIYYFLGIFPEKFNSNKAVDSTVYVSGAFVSILSLTGAVVKDVSIRSDGTDILPGLFYSAFIFFELFVIIAVIYRSYHNKRKMNSLQKNKIRLLYYGLYFAFIWALICNVILPIIAPDLKTTRYGTYGTTVFIISVGIAIIRYKLFDIPTLVVRSFVYVLTVASLVSVYSTASLLFKSFLVEQETNHTLSTLLEVFLLSVFGVSFAPLRNIFDSATTRVFFRNHYNAQSVIKMVNDIAAHSVDLAKMLHRVGGVIRSSLLVEYVSFILLEKNSEKRINVGQSPDDLHISAAVQKLFRKHNVVIVARINSGDIPAQDMRYLHQNRIAAVVRLRKIATSHRDDNEGYVVIGQKQSGRRVNSNDEHMLEIISGQLAAAIQNLLHLDEIVDFNIKLQHEVSDATSELKVKNTRLQQLDHSKDEFVSMASHQLRTPLTSVKGYLSMVLDGDAGELKPEQKQLLEQAYTSTQRMVYLIADLLNVSRLNTGKFVINAEPTSLAMIIEGEIQQVQKTAELKGVRVSFFCDPSIPDISLDQMKTRQVIMNFIDNAIYYTPAGGVIDISLRKEASTAVFSVADSGMGVPKLEQRHLFTKFYRATNARKSRPDGTGLGLYMAKKVVDAQGGELIFQSREGEGSTFGFSFSFAV